MAKCLFLILIIPGVNHSCDPHHVSVTRTCILDYSDPSGKQLAFLKKPHEKESPTAEIPMSLWRQIASLNTPEQKAGGLPFNQIRSTVVILKFFCRRKHQKKTAFFSVSPRPINVSRFFGPKIFDIQILNLAERIDILT